MLENLDFEQDYYTKTAKDINKIGNDFFRLMKCLAYNDRPYYVKMKYYALMGSVLKFLNESS